AEARLVDGLLLGLELVGRGADAPEEEGGVGVEGDGAVGQADHPLARGLGEREEFAAGLDLVVVVESAEFGIQTEEGKADELPLDSRGLAGLRLGRGLRPAMGGGVGRGLGRGLAHVLLLRPSVWLSRLTGKWRSRRVSQ